MKVGLFTILLSIASALSTGTANAGCFGARRCCQATPIACPPTHQIGGGAPGPMIIQQAPQLANPAPQIVAPAPSSADAGSGIIVSEQRTQNYTVMREVREVRPDGSIIVKQVPEVRTRTYTVQKELTNLEVIERKVDKLLNHYKIQFP